MCLRASSYNTRLYSIDSANSSMQLSSLQPVTYIDPSLGKTSPGKVCTLFESDGYLQRHPRLSSQVSISLPTTPSSPRVCPDYVSNNTYLHQSYLSVVNFVVVVPILVSVCDTLVLVICRSHSKNRWDWPTAMSFLLPKAQIHVQCQEHLYSTEECGA